MACGPLFMSLVVVVSGQQLLWAGAQLIGSHLQGQDKWHPLHFGVSPEWLWDSAPASSPWWCGLLQLRECSPGQSFPFAWALLGVTLKLVLRFLWKWGGPYTPDLNEAQCWFSTNGMNSDPEHFCFVGESVGVGRPCFLGWNICDDLSHPYFHLLVAKCSLARWLWLFLAQLQALMAWFTWGQTPRLWMSTSVQLS